MVGIIKGAIKNTSVGRLDQLDDRSILARLNKSHNNIVWLPKNMNKINVFINAS